MLSEINRLPESTFCMIPRASLLARTVKNLPAMLETQVRSPRVGKIPWKGEWKPTPAFLPGEFHVQRSLVGYSRWGQKESESDTTDNACALTKVFKLMCNKEQNCGCQELGVGGYRDLFQFSSVAQSCPTLCDPMNRSTPGLPVHHQLPEFTQTHVHRVGDTIQPSHPLSSSSPPAPDPSHHQGLFQ